MAALPRAQLRQSALVLDAGQAGLGPAAPTKLTQPLAAHRLTARDVFSAARQYALRAKWQAAR